MVSTEYGEYTRQIIEEYNLLWNSKFCEPYDDFINSYRIKYELVKEQKRIAKLNNLAKLRKNGAERALLISATGTGKTFASAFALREESPQKALFLVHREQIAKQALKSYRKILWAGWSLSPGKRQLYKMTGDRNFLL